MTNSSCESSTWLTPVRLRDLRASDRPELERILRATAAFPDHEVAVALELIDHALAAARGAARRADDYCFAVAEHDGGSDVPGRVVGYACWGRNPMSDGVFDLYWIAVDPAAQGGGAGRVLMAEAESKARAAGGRMVLVETGGQPSFAPTRRFYERIGYVEVARLPDFFRVGDDKVIYGRRFDGATLAQATATFAAAAH